MNVSSTNRIGRGSDTFQTKRAQPSPSRGGDRAKTGRASPLQPCPPLPVYAELVFHIVFYEPRIPGNTGAAIRLAACTGATLHLVEPLGFSFEDSHLKRAGLDYHDLADLRIHADFEALLRELPDSRIFAFTGHTSNSFADVAYRETDAFLFGPEPTGLPADVIAHPAVTAAVRIPMMPHLRSLNLANSASIVVYEAWRQCGYVGSSDFS